MSETTRKSVAVVGASRARHKFGNKSVRAHRAAGWQVFPVNPRGGEIEGLTAYRSLGEVPADLDRITVYLPPASTRELLPAIRAKGAAEVWLNPGASNAAVEAEARASGLVIRAGCSIVDLGLSPSDFP